MSSGTVVVVGDAFGAGRGDWMSLAPRLAEACDGGVGISLAGEGGIRTAHARIESIRGLGIFSVGVLMLGTEDAAGTPPLRPWLTLLRQCFRALIRQTELVVVVLPMEIPKELGAPDGYGKEARRWTRRIRQEITNAISDENDGCEDSRVMIVDPNGRVDDGLRSDAVWLKPSGYEAVAEMIADVIGGMREQRGED